MAEALELRHVSAGYGETVVLEDISLALAPGESISVIGRNGVGKTTLLATVMGHTTLHTGEVRLGGVSLDRVPVFRRARNGLGFVPQEREIFPSLSVRENLEVGARPGPWTQERVFELFPNLGLRLSNMGHQLSGGEQQMLSIGRALMAAPKVLLLDEPSLGVSPLLTERLYEALAEINAQGTTILLVEQNANKALALATRGYVMETGSIVLADECANLRTDEQVRKAYLGEE
jgi:branched-chain amino acid transport system ATP-binding protein